MGHSLTIRLQYRRFTIPRSVEVDLAIFEETFNCDLNVRMRTPPSYVWAFEGEGQIWYLKRYRTLASVARAVAPMAAVRGTSRLTLLPSVRVPRRDLEVPELVLKQLEFVRAIGQDDLLRRSSVLQTADRLGLAELSAILQAPGRLYGDTLTTFGMWRYHATRSDSPGDTSHGRLDGDS